MSWTEIRLTVLAQQFVKSQTRVKKRRILLTLVYLVGRLERGKHDASFA